MFVCRCNHNLLDDRLLEGVGMKGYRLGGVTDAMHIRQQENHGEMPTNVTTTMATVRTGFHINEELR